jgi:hypothetical protein
MLARSDVPLGGQAECDTRVGILERILLKPAAVCRLRALSALFMRPFLGLWISISGFESLGQPKFAPGSAKTIMQILGIFSLFSS